MTMTIPILVGVILAFNQLLKNAGVPTKFLPLISMVLGLGAGFFFLPGATLQITIFNGIAIGLGSNGLFDFAKSTVIAPTYYKVIDDANAGIDEAEATDVEATDTIDNTIGFKSNNVK